MSAVLFNLGLLVLRLVLGLTFMGHGGQKLFGWFSGPGLSGTISMMQRLGARPARLWALAAALAEFGGGLLLALGLFSPLGSLGVIAAMLVAIIQVHWSKGFWNTKGGIEFPLINMAVALALALTGSGSYSLDAVLGTSFPEPATLLVGLALVLLGVLAEQGSISHQQVKPSSK
jgi:putative oxidoreductase